MSDPSSAASGASIPEAQPSTPPQPQISEPHDAAQAAPKRLLAALDFTLTVGQAQKRFAELRRHIPKDRTVQNYCLKGDIVAQKIRTTFGMEWIINAASLDAFILSEPELPSGASDASSTNSAAQATHVEMKSSAPAPANPSQGGASDASPERHSLPVGETRSIVDVLIQNARLLAQVEDRDQMIVELKQERTFMQDQVRSAVHLSERALTQGDTLLKTIQVMRLGPGGSDVRQMPDN